MGYSLKQSEFDESKQGAEFTYFSEEEWSSYPFASEQDTKWFREAKYGLFRNAQGTVPCAYILWQIYEYIDN